MKPDVKRELKEKGRQDIFTEERYTTIVSLMKYTMKTQLKMKLFLEISPEIRVSFVADHMIKFTDLGKI